MIKLYDNNGNQYKKLIIIDGSSLLVTCYYGMPSTPKDESRMTEEELKKAYSKMLHNKDGVLTGAVYAFLKNVYKIINNQKPTHIAFVFDKSREKLERRKQYPLYKAQRKPVPDGLRQQFITIEETLEKIGFPVFYRDGEEADDFAGTIIKNFEKEIATYVYTKDHDYIQLISDNTSLWLGQTKQDKVIELAAKYGASIEDLDCPEKSFEFNEFTAEMEFGILPCQIPDLKGLQGDSSDNIPGIPRLSAAAVPLLQRYGTIEKIYEAIDACGDDKKLIKALNDDWKANLGGVQNPYNALVKEFEYTEDETKMNHYLKTARESALLSKKLATINTNVPMDITLNDLAIELNKEKMDEVLTYLDIRTLPEINEQYFV